MCDEKVDCSGFTTRRLRGVITMSKWNWRKYATYEDLHKSRIGEATKEDIESLTRINTRCVRCNSPNTSHWRVDHNGYTKFYCELDWLLYKVVDLPSLEKLGEK